MTKRMTRGNGKRENRSTTERSTMVHFGAQVSMGKREPVHWKDQRPFLLHFGNYKYMIQHYNPRTEHYS
jgi:hypothetical protein